MDYSSLPSFDDLPLQKDGPPGNAWGLFGPKDELGMLNLITPETVAAAAKEIQRGVRVSLDWPLDKPRAPTFGRQKFHHQLLPSDHTFMNDDAVHFNTQSSTQWDGFRHYGYQKAKLYFNNHTQQQLEQGTDLGIDVWAKNGGIVGRGVLLDWAEWAPRNGIEVKPFETGAVELGHLEKIIQEQKIELRPADILFIRVGFTEQYDQLSTEQQEGFPDRKPGGLLGLEATRESLRWLWSNRFTAIASDSPSFERGPATGSYNEPDVSIHQWALAGWGLPLGELFDLEELARQCRELGRYSFFVSSVPLKIPQGVASPPNAIAIF